MLRAASFELRLWTTAYLIDPLTWDKLINLSEFQFSDLQVGYKN
jgi:hypothetical protein